MLPFGIDADNDTEASMKQRVKALGKVMMKAREAEVKRLSRRHHPDKGGDPILFKLLREVLDHPEPWGGDNSTRSRSDTPSSTAQKRSAPASPGQPRKFMKKDSANPFSDAFAKESDYVTKKKRKGRAKKTFADVTSKKPRNVTKLLRQAEKDLEAAKDLESDLREDKAISQTKVESKKKKLDAC
jgi:hypothetical protein